MNPFVIHTGCQNSKSQFFPKKLQGDKKREICVEWNGITGWWAIAYLYQLISVWWSDGILVALVVVSIAAPAQILPLPLPIRDSRGEKRRGAPRPRRGRWRGLDLARMAGRRVGGGLWLRFRAPSVHNNSPRMGDSLARVALAKRRSPPGDTAAVAVTSALVNPTTRQWCRRVLSCVASAKKKSNCRGWKGHRESPVVRAIENKSDRCQPHATLITKKFINHKSNIKIKFRSHNWISDNKNFETRSHLTIF
jgi:hypothetical protein